MAGATFTDETLMAFADGALDDATARRVVEAARCDERVASRIALFRSTREVLDRTAEAERADPVPDALMARVRATIDREPPNEAAGNVVAWGGRPREGRSRSVAWPAAIVASLALAVGLGTGWIIAPTGEEGALNAFDSAWVERAGLTYPLSRLRSGESGTTEVGDVTLVSSFRDASGAFCREFEIATEAQTYVSVACHGGGSWEVRFAAVTGGTVEGYAPASSLDALDAYLAGIGAGAPLDAEAEAAALSEPGG
ncbi:hypothetical protein OCH239_12320 [Roseivivax halodurans JCM 10272]|uniref:Anti-sigma factor n=1 Tax=Roseivivax halodurans JCM 10272 TaxID=1449350 RepID=X7EDL8_9RHOB|nr:hypothetical protein [Roseivivax halodurans]ETX13286.1 hypothetical protein OCH239_12320 [Roseivivax halodurans JCM 10272]